MHMSGEDDRVRTVPRMSIASETVHIDGSQKSHFNLAGKGDCVRIGETQVLTVTVMRCGFYQSCYVHFLQIINKKLKKFTYMGQQTLL